jgi:eukaryotic-like serine/threonine-protein kinase
LAQEVLAVALEMNPAERGSYLDDACVNGGVLRSEIESLVQSYAGDGAFLEGAASVGYLVLQVFVSSWKGRRLGAYQIEDEIGEGGMGAVFAPLAQTECTTSKWPLR